MIISYYKLMEIHWVLYFIIYDEVVALLSLMLLDIKHYNIVYHLI